MEKSVVRELALILVLAFGVVAFAGISELPDWHNEMIQWPQGRLDEAVE